MQIPGFLVAVSQKRTKRAVSSQCYNYLCLPIKVYWKLEKAFLGDRILSVKPCNDHPRKSNGYREEKVK